MGEFASVIIQTVIVDMVTSVVVTFSQLRLEAVNGDIFEAPGSSLNNHVFCLHSMLYGGITNINFWSIPIQAIYRYIVIVNKIYPCTRKYRSLLPEAYDHVFITDSDDVFNWAMKNSFLLRMGPYIINPIWNAVLLFDEIIDQNCYICADQTLILHIQSIANYENLIPRICGTYNRLVLHGNFTWDQAKRLINANVIEIRIIGRLEIPPTQHNNFDIFVMRHCQSKEHKYDRFT
uniref:Glycosyltransferase family 92 protein n=1 Tax=Panagrellus redivivus TaxID=6233 RepID=A0A7E4V6V1_PANRE